MYFGEIVKIGMRNDDRSLESLIEKRREEGNQRREETEEVARPSPVAGPAAYPLVR